MAEETPGTPEGGTVEAHPAAEVLQLTHPKSDESLRSIGVNGEYRSKAGYGHYGEYGQYGLKHAILYFLDELLAGDLDELPAPHIVLGPITLKLWRDSGEYVAYGEPTGNPVPRTRMPSMELFSSSREDELGHNLRKFAVNRNWLMLVVNFSPVRQLCIWKKPGGGYGIAGFGIPKTVEEWNWHPHS